MVVTLANVIQKGVVIFTSSLEMPVLTVTPAFGAVESIEPIWLAYSQDGPGDYDLAIQSTTSCMDHKQKSSRKHCTCGKHRFYQGSACVSRSDPEGLRTKCPCYLRGNACSSSCRYSNCENPLGRRQRLTKRVRQTYSDQKQLLKERPSAQFVETSQEDQSYGSLSLLECSIIRSIIIYMFAHKMEYSAETVTSIFSMIFQLTKRIESINFHIYPRSPILIAMHLKSFNKQVFLLQKLKDN